MPAAYNRIVWSIVNAIEAGSDVLAKILLGNPTGARLEYPETGLFKKAMDRGRLWSELLVPTILEHVGIELDSFGISVAHISTSATGVIPVLNWGLHVSTVTKNEGANTITVNFDASHTSTNFVVFGVIPDLLSSCLTVALGTTSAEIFFWDPTSGAPITINNRTVYFVSFGER